MADPSLTFEQELLKTAIQAAVPTVILIFGGRWIINFFEVSKKRREQTLELARFVREQQYQALQELYSLFSEFMRLYRRINSRHTDLSDLNIRSALLEECMAAESRVEGVILRIASEFTHDNRDDLENRLGQLRQSVQLWRERLTEEQRLPFHYSEQYDYVRFKHSFAGTVTYLAAQIYQRLEPAEVQAEESQQLLQDIFNNKWEVHGPDVDKF